MKFDELATRIINEYTYDIQNRLAELKGYKPAAQINMLLTDLEYASNPETKQSIEQALQGFDAELVKRAQAVKAKEKSLRGGEVSGQIGIPPRPQPGSPEAQFRSRERNA